MENSAYPPIAPRTWQHQGVADGAVRRAFDWIEASAIPVEGGLGWLENGTLYDHLYSGAAGVLLGCAEATAAGVPGLEPIATGARDRLVHLAGLDDRPAHLAGDDATAVVDGLFEGWPGAAVALRAWAAVAGDDRAAETAASLTGWVAERMRRRPDDPGRWTDIISGDAGILLALVPDAAEPVVADAVARLADGLVGLGLDRPDGLHWRMSPSYEAINPGFSHGTAGVAYALATAGVTLGRTDLVAVAVRAADGLIALGTTPAGWALPLRMPTKPGLPPVNFGWCHGPTGTVRLFVLLDAIVPDQRWQRAVAACVRALRDSRLPERLYPGYWDNVARCCGTAGVGQVLLDRYRATGDRSYLEWAGRLADDVLARRLTTPQGVTWSNVEHTADPPDLPPAAGFMQGTAGIAGWLARLASPATPAVLDWL